MVRLLLYFVVLMVFIPLASSAKHGTRSHAPGVIINNAFPGDEDGLNDTLMTTTPERWLQDTAKEEKKKRIKEVARAKPQAKPEKVEKRQPDPEPQPGANRPDPRTVRPPVEQGGGARPGPPAGGGRQGGGQGNQPPPRSGGR